MRNRLVVSNAKSSKSSIFAPLLEQIGREESTQVLRLTRDVNLAEAVRTAVEDEDCKLVVAAGGDGTVNLVVNALMCLKAELRPRLAILPTGTANDFAGTLKISDDIHQVIHSLPDEEFVPIDVVRCRAGGFERFFANVAAGGNSVQVTESMTDDLKATWGPLCYLRAIGVLGAMKNFRIQATIDGESLDVDSWGVLVANWRTECRTDSHCAYGISHGWIARLNHHQERRLSRHGRNCLDDSLLEFTGMSASYFSAGAKTTDSLYSKNAFYSRRRSHRRSASRIRNRSRRDSDAGWPWLP